MQHVDQQQADSYDLGQRRIIAGRPSPQDHLAAPLPERPTVGLRRCSSRAYPSSLTLKPMDFVRSGGFIMSRLPLSPYQPRLAAALKNQQVRLR